jgi:translation initiation factor 3 subunit G
VNGVKTITTHRTNDVGQRVRTERTVKVTKTTVKIPKAVLARRKWPKFGLESAKPAGYHGRDYASEWVSFDVNEQILDMKPKLVVAEERNESAERAFEKMNATSFEAWRPKNRGDATVNAAKAWAESQGIVPRDTGDGPELRGGGGGGSLAALSAGRPGGYVPPSLRNADGSRNAEMAQRDDSCTVRVSNLSEEVKDSDLRELFRRFGGIQRVYLAKDKETQQSRGFAFINFYNKEDAATAIAKLDGHGYDHLILSVDWANPSSAAPAPAPSMGRDAFPSLGGGPPVGGGPNRAADGRPLFRGGGDSGDARVENKYDSQIHSSSLDRYR